MTPSLEVSRPSCRTAGLARTRHQFGQKQEAVSPSSERGELSRLETRPAAERPSRLVVKLIEKSVIVHREPQNGFGLRIRGQAPVCVEHVHVGGAAWRAGVRQNDIISKINGLPICDLNHKSVVLMLKGCAHFVALTLLCSISGPISARDEGLYNRTTTRLDGLSPFGDLSGGRLESQQSRYFQLTALRSSFTRVNSSSKLASNLNEDLLSRGLATSNSGGANVSDGSYDGKHDKCATEEPEQQRGAQACCCGPLGAEASGGATCSKCQLTLETQRRPSARTDRMLAACQRYTNHHLQHSGSLREQQAPPDCAVEGGHKQRLATISSSISGQSSGADRNQTAQLQMQQRSQIQQATQKVDKRLEIVREFLETERAHTERLRYLDELFYRPLEATGLMTGEQLKAVFSCHRTLYKIHKQIYRILLSATSASGNASAPWAARPDLANGAHQFAFSVGPLVGSALSEIFDRELRRKLERAACLFCSAQATNADLLNKLTRRDTKVGEFLAQVTSQRSALGRLGVKDLLASCFQRLTKYPLLLENLLKATPSEAPPDDDDNDEQRLALLSTITRAADDDGQSPFATLENETSRSFAGTVKLGEAQGEGREEGGEEEGGAQRDEKRLCQRHFDSCLSLADQAAEQRRQLVLEKLLQQRRNSRRMLTISLAEERELIQRSLQQSRLILTKVNESIKVALARQKFKEIWRKTEKSPNVLPALQNASKQQVIHEGALTLRLSKRSFDVYMVLLNDYLIILAREGRDDKLKLKYFSPEGRSLSSALQQSGVVSSAAQQQSQVGTSISGGALNNSTSGAQSGAAGGWQAPMTNLAGASTGASAQANASGSSSHSSLMALASSAPQPSSSLNLPIGIGAGNQVYSPVFIIDEHLTTRDAATDENGFYLLCKRRDDSRIYEFAARSPAERMKWRDLIQGAIERKINRSQRRASCASTITRSSIASIESTCTAPSSLLAPSHISGARRRTGSGPLPGTLEAPRQGDKVGPDRITKGDRSAFDPAGTSYTRKVGVDHGPQQLPGASGSAAGDGVVAGGSASAQRPTASLTARPPTPNSAGEPTRIVGTISYVMDDEIVMPSKMESSRIFVDQAIQVNILDGSTSSARAKMTRS